MSNPYMLECKACYSDPYDIRGSLPIACFNNVVCRMLDAKLANKIDNRIKTEPMIIDSASWTGR